jgi:hypothetical protein
MAETGAKAEGAAAAREGAEEEPREEQNEVNEIRAEEESATAMDADVPHPPDEAQGDDAGQT